MSTFAANGPLAAEFRQRFGTDPELYAFAPGRASLLGAFADDKAIGLTVPFGVSIALGFRNDRRFEFDSLQDAPVSLDALPDREQSFGWADSLCGVIRAFDKVGVDVPGINLLADCNLPPAAGLGRRSALAVALAIAVNRKRDVGLHPIQLAVLTKSSESQTLDVPVYLVDPATILCGRAGQVVVLDYVRQKVFHLKSPAKFLIAHSGSNVHIERSVLNARDRQLEAALWQLGQVLGQRFISFAELQAAQFDKVNLDEELLLRARYVLGENARAAQAARALDDGDLSTLGKLMNASQAALRSEFELSLPERDRLLEWLGSRPEVLGANTAGNGGFTVSLLLPGSEASVLDALHREFYAKLGLPDAPPAFLTGAEGGAVCSA